MLNYQTPWSPQIRKNVCNWALYSNKPHMRSRGSSSLNRDGNLPMGWQPHVFTALNAILRIVLILNLMPPVPNNMVRLLWTKLNQLGNTILLLVYHYICTIKSVYIYIQANPRVFQALIHSALIYFHIHIMLIFRDVALIAVHIQRSEGHIIMVNTFPLKYNSPIYDDSWNTWWYGGIYITDSLRIQSIDCRKTLFLESTWIYSEQFPITWHFFRRIFPGHRMWKTERRQGAVWRVGEVDQIRYRCRPGRGFPA
jgi:hypothetical protein